MLRAASPVALAGQARGERVVVARFVDMAALLRRFDSPQYQALVSLREAAADVVLAAYAD